MYSRKHPPLDTKGRATAGAGTELDRLLVGVIFP